MPFPRIRDLSKHFSGVQRSQSEKSKDKQTFLAQKAQLPKKAAGGPLPTKATTEAVEIPGWDFIFVFNVIEIVLIAGFKSCLSYFIVAVVVVVVVVV